MHLKVQSRKFRIWKVITMVACAVEIAIIIVYTVLIALQIIPHIEEIEGEKITKKVTQEQLTQEIFNKIFDVAFHGLGIYGAATHNHGVMIAFHVLTFLSKYFAVSEAISNNYFWPYAISSIIVFALCSVFYKQLRSMEKAEVKRRRRCPHCGDDGNSESDTKETTVPKDVAVA
ncbi:hypothetical protein TYRP_015264 [Tyrophagus putrescentiae]|nr:hypothetical protein TYRP_015264 [Tyrophagus putrescentiae]